VLFHSAAVHYAWHRVCDKEAWGATDKAALPQLK
jgi:hypothetical protein